MKFIKLTFLIFSITTFVTISCSQIPNASNSEGETNNESELRSFTFTSSLDPFLDLDSILNTIPDTFGFEIIETGDSLDLRLSRANKIERAEWKKYYKNPTVTSSKVTNNSMIFIVEFTGGAGYSFDGNARSTSDSLFLYYWEAHSRDKDAVFQDTRYILTYDFNKLSAKDKTVSIEYQKPLVGTK